MEQEKFDRIKLIGQMMSHFLVETDIDTCELLGLPKASLLSPRFECRCFFVSNFCVPCRHSNILPNEYQVVRIRDVQIFRTIQ